MCQNIQVPWVSGNKQKEGVRKACHGITKAE